MQQPGFWKNPPDRPGFLAKLLSPLSLVWTFFTNRRLKNGPWHRIDIPVICVGNINMGGTGKTPAVIALVEHLKAKGLKPHVVSRGYGGSLSGPVKVVISRHKAAQVGDEPLQIAPFCDTWIAQERHRGAQAAASDGADVVILDDGLQNPSLFKSISFVVVDATIGFGNRRVFPAGPLREDVETGLARADALLLVGAPSRRKAFLENENLARNLPVLESEINVLETGMDWKSGKYLAFAGIAHPEKFFNTLRGLGAKLIRTEPLNDHQPLTPALLKRMEAEAFFQGAQLVTTEKDATRLPEDFRFRVVSLPVRLAFRNVELLDDLLRKAKVGRTAETL